MTEQSDSSIRRPADGERPRSYKTEALVLRSRSMREADRLITILTPNLGKLPVTVRGARRITSRLGGHLDTFNHVHLTLALGHHIDVVTGAESIESFGALKASLSGIATGLYIMELADALLPDALPHQGAYTILLDALRALDRGESIDGVARFTELRLLEDSGYMPELANCQICGSEITPEHHRFAPGLGGVVDDTCGVPMGQVLPLSLNALKILRHYGRTTMVDAVQVRLSPTLRDELERILEVSIHYVLEREMATTDFVGHLKQLRSRAANSLRPSEM